MIRKTHQKLTRKIHEIFLVLMMESETFTIGTLKKIFFETYCRWPKHEINLAFLMSMIINIWEMVYSYIEITLPHECSPINLLHIFRTHFCNNTYGGLLLKVHQNIWGFLRTIDDLNMCIKLWFLNVDNQYNKQHRCLKASNKSQSLTLEGTWKI